MASLIGATHISSSSRAKSRDARCPCIASFFDLREISLRDLAAGGEPHAVMAADVFERGVKRTDAIGLAGQIRMEADRHRPPRFRTLAIERVELIADHLTEFVRHAVVALE